MNLYQRKSTNISYFMEIAKHGAIWQEFKHKELLIRNFEINYKLSEKKISCSKFLDLSRFFLCFFKENKHRSPKSTIWNIVNILYWNKGYKLEIPRYASLSSVSYHSPFLDQPLVIATIDTDFENKETCLTDEQIWTRGYSNII